MIWALDLDDFKGTFCGEGKYPLLNAIVNVLFKGGIPVVPATPGPEPPKPTGDKPGPEPTEEPVCPLSPNPANARRPARPWVSPTTARTSSNAPAPRAASDSLVPPVSFSTPPTRTAIGPLMSTAPTARCK